MAKKSASKAGKANASPPASASASASASSVSSLLNVDTVAAPVFREGKSRPYLATEVPVSVTKSRSFSASEWPLLAVLFVVGAWVRLRNISLPNSVVFDEVHFGGFSKKYVLGKFFMDVHPPLAKMLFAAVASLGGYDGEFDFAAIGDVFPDTVPFVLMRSFAALLGLATVFLCYFTLRASGVRPVVAFITSACLLLENSFVTISKYILLDSPLIFFVASAIYAFKKFEIQQPFSFPWYRSLLSCGISLGLAFSSKWVGLFTIAWVGVLSVVHMWFLIGDLQVKTPVVLKNAIARASFFLGVPLVLYLAFFSVHFNILSTDGDGSAFMSSAFRSGLAGANVPSSTTGPVGYGSIITVRHVNTRGGYLHSHKHFYPAGSKQQQVTLYPHLDSNNDWLIEPYNTSLPVEFVPIKNGDKVRLKHVRTWLRLHSHDEKPPVTDRDWQREVSCYGYEGFEGDANDDWIVEIVKHKTPKNARDELRAIDSVFRLRHAMSGHYLFATNTKLPEEWGFGQQEVTSASQGARHLTHWYIESNKNVRYTGDDVATYPKLSFFQKLIESHKVMWNINSGLTSHHNWQSEPHEWPALLRGINYWSRNHTQVYFIGNPIVWWTASACLFGFIVHAAITLVKWQAGSTLNLQKASFNYNYQMFTYFVGWAVHYLPFFIMGRQLFLHHYLPAQYFAILGLGHFFDLLVTSSQKYSKPAYGFLVVFLAVTAVSYNMLSPLISGTPWTKAQCLSSKIVSGWDYDCNTFFDTPKQYQEFLASSQTEAVSSTTSAFVVNEAKETPGAVEFENKAVAPSEDVLEEPPAAETHFGEWPVGDKVVEEEIPQGELYDEATFEKDDEAAQEPHFAETLDEGDEEFVEGDEELEVGDEEEGEYFDDEFDDEYEDDAHRVADAEVSAPTEPIVEPVSEPVAQPIVEQVAEPVVEQVAEPVAEPVVEQVVEPVEPEFVAPAEPVAAQEILEQKAEQVVN